MISIILGFLCVHCFCSGWLIGRRQLRDVMGIEVGEEHTFKKDTGST